MTKKELHFYLSSFIDNPDSEILEEVMKKTLLANQSFNLTAIKEENDFREKMIFDSALPLKQLNLANKKAIDIGTGAGFPGLVISILGKAHLDLLDATKKKIDYLNNLKEELNLDITGINDRAEIYSKNHREEYDIAFVRSVSELKVLLEIISPMLKVGGTLVAYKGPNVDEEIKKSKIMLDKLNLSIFYKQEEILPLSQEHRIILYIKKNKVTSLKYPREYKEIVK